MNTFHEPTEGVAQSGDLNPILCNDVEGKREFWLQLGLAVGDADLSIQHTVFLHDFPYAHCAVQLTSLDSGESVSTVTTQIAAQRRVLKLMVIPCPNHSFLGVEPQAVQLHDPASQQRRG